MPDGTNVFRNSRLEEREAKRFEADRQQRREKLFLQVQEEFEKESGQPGLIQSVKSVTLFNPLLDPHRLALTFRWSLIDSHKNLLTNGRQNSRNLFKEISLKCPLYVGVDCNSMK